MSQVRHPEVRAAGAPRRTRADHPLRYGFAARLRMTEIGCPRCWRSIFLHPPALWMMRGRRFGMRLEEMVQDMQQGERVRLVADGLGVPDIVHDHVADLLAAVLVTHEILPECGGGALGQVLVPGDGEHLLL